MSVSIGIHPELLIVDDNPADIVLTREALAGGKYSVQISSVEDGEEALAFLNHREKYKNTMRPGLVLLDLNLPKKDGKAVLAAMKTDPELRGIPVIVFSTSKLGRDIARSYELGANCYVSKPGNLNDFFSAIKMIEEFWFGLVTAPPRGE
jgi:CheY-like chemotaxis protein